MSVLMIDVGGSNVKIMAAHDGEVRKLESHRRMSAREMVEGVVSLAKDWDYEKISIGFPGLVRDGRPVREPLNLGGGWVDFDYSAALGGKPVRFINDAAMQALGNYRSGRLLFLGLGTSTGTTIIVDDTVIPIEIGMLKLTRKSRFMDSLSKQALKADGLENWAKSAREAVAMLQNVFNPDVTILGGGNAKKLTPSPAHCILVDNRSAYVGARRLWEDADLYASACVTSWHIHHNEAHK